MFIVPAGDTEASDSTLYFNNAGTASASTYESIDDSAGAIGMIVQRNGSVIPLGNVTAVGPSDWAWPNETAKGDNYEVRAISSFAVQIDTTEYTGATWSDWFTISSDRTVYMNADNGSTGSSITGTLQIRNKTNGITISRAFNGESY